jgi:transposase
MAGRSGSSRAGQRQLCAKPVHKLRDLTRYRRTLVENQGSERRRLIKLLEAADITLAGVVSDIFGVSGRAILRALIECGHSTAEMSKLTRGDLRKKRGQLIEALAGELAWLVMQLARVEADEADIAALDRQIEQRLVFYAARLDLLMTIPCIDWVVAATVIAEIGVDMSVFPSHRHLAAWSGTCPGNNESAGKHKPSRARRGNPYLKTALCNAVIAAARKRGCFYKAISGNTAYRELGEDYFDTRDTERATRRYVRRLEDLGFTVILQAQPQTQVQGANAL